MDDELKLSDSKQKKTNKQNSTSTLVQPVRGLAAGLGVLSAGLIGCEQRPKSNKLHSKSPIKSSQAQSDQVRSQNHMMPGTPAPPATGSPGGGMGMGAGTPPMMGGGATPGIAPGPTDLRTFSIVPATTTLNSVMMASQTLADGVSLPVWSFGNGFNDDRAVPAPVIEAVEGQPVAITLTSMMPHSIHFHGLDVDMPNDGVPLTSGYVASMVPPNGFGRVQSYTNLGASFVYQFIAPHAGTYMYHCHVDTVLHMEMGMAGAMIVRPADGSLNTAWTNGPIYDKEYIWHLHTFDSRWHSERISGPATVQYNPDYFLINGRDGAALQTDATTAISGNAGDTVLLRVVNLGYLPSSVVLGNLAFDVIASDGRPLAEPVTQVKAWRIMPGERYDILFVLPTLTDVEASVVYYHINGETLLGKAVTTIKSV